MNREGIVDNIGSIKLDDPLPLNFLEKYSERSAFIAELEGASAPPVNAAWVESALFENLYRPEEVNFLQNGSIAQGFPELRKDGFVAGASIRKALEEDISVRIISICRFDKELSKWARRLARNHNYAIEGNMYVTAGKNPALKPHQDEHDVFVYQVEGTKRWSIKLPSDGHPQLPVKNMIKSISSDLESCETIDLTPGKALYLPRGFLHCAECIDGRSVHITFRLLPVIWQHLLRKAVEIASENVLDLRRSVRHINGTEQAEVLSQLKQALDNPDIIRRAYGEALHEMRQHHDYLMVGAQDT